MVLEDFVLPFEGKLDANNRWVKLSKIIPWEQIELDYADLFPSDTGMVAKPLRAVNSQSPPTIASQRAARNR
jgi:hypothetical protein